MKTRHLLFVFIVLIISLFCGCSAVSSSEKLEENSEDVGQIDKSIMIYDYRDNIDATYIEEVIAELCTQKLYSERDIYDTGHMLMLPMRYGFMTSNDEIVESFRYLFTNFVDDTDSKEKQFFLKEMSGLNRNHWLYLVAEYMVYCVDCNYEIDKKLFDTVVELMADYNYTYTGNFDGSIKYNSFQEAMEGVLHGPGYGRPDSLNNKITDNDTFPLAIMCDCLYVCNELNYSCEYIDLLEWSGKCAEDMFKTAVEWISEDSWILQPGGWTDHNDYLFAGYQELADVDPHTPIKVDGIGEDTSHYRRIASFLNSFSRVSSDKQYFELLKTGLANQLVDVLIEKDSSDKYYIIRNYVDGNNGVFRYNNHTGRGYGPYQMSTSLIDGWWSLLNDGRVREIYAIIYENIRYESQIPGVYVDPYTTRERNPFYTNINNFKMLTYIASLDL